jgi:hypothetical protein
MEADTQIIPRMRHDRERGDGGSEVKAIPPASPGVTEDLPNAPGKTCPLPPKPGEGQHSVCTIVRLPKLP